MPDCPAGYYNSVFIARRDDPRRNSPDFTCATFAYNEPMSQSGWAAPTPGLPYIATTGTDKPNLFSAIAEAISSLPSATRDTLQIKGLINIPAAEYLAIPTPDGPDQHIS